MKMPPKEKQKAHLDVSEIKLLDPAQLYSEEELRELEKNNGGHLDT